MRCTSCCNALSSGAAHLAPVLLFPKVRDMTGDGGVVKRIARKGEGEFPLDCPLEDSRVRLHYRQAGA